MSEPSTAFAIALSSHDFERVRDAFAQCNEDMGTTYNRTTLGRWLEASIPRDEAFVRRLGELLGDPTLVEAWRDAKRSGTGGVDAAIDRFRSLSEDDRARAFAEIRRLYLERHSLIRTRLGIRVELSDSSAVPDHVFNLRLTVSWTGGLPENANVTFMTKESGLGLAFEDPNCLFRDEVLMDQDLLDRLLEDSEQVLSYNPLDEINHNMPRLTGQRDGQGVFRFDNEQVTRANVRLDLQYPYPRSQKSFPIQFGKYQVADRVEINFRSQSDAVSDLQCAGAYLPLGSEREYTSTTPGDSELAVYLGTEGLLMTEGNGVVLSWA